MKSLLITNTPLFQNWRKNWLTNKKKNGENVVGPYKFRRNSCGLKHNKLV